MQSEPNGESAGSNTAGSGSKLSRLIDQYHLNDLGSQLEEYWLASSDERYSLRGLAEYVNHQLLRTVMRNAGMDPLDGEVENTYRLLTADDVSTGTRTQTRRRLQRANIDVEALEADFVSRQAIHTYLTKDRGVSYTPDEGDSVTKEATVIQGFKRRLKATVHSKLDRLRTANEVTLGEFEVLVDVRVLCEDCGAQYQTSEFLETQTCDCSHNA
jgi:hypothetical protein